MVPTRVGRVAQLAEHSALNRQVVGSIPTASTRISPFLLRIRTIEKIKLARNYGLSTCFRLPALPPGESTSKWIRQFWPERQQQAIR